MKNLKTFLIEATKEEIIDIVIGIPIIKDAIVKAYEKNRIKELLAPNTDKSKKLLDLYGKYLLSTQYKGKEYKDLIGFINLYYEGNDMHYLIKHLTLET